MRIDEYDNDDSKRETLNRLSVFALFTPIMESARGQRVNTPLAV